MAKGGDFERLVGPHLSLWWTGGRHDDTIWHTHGSGGRATTRRRAGKRTSGQAGDLCSTDPLSRGLFRLFAFELKIGYQQVKLNDLIDRPANAAYQKDGWDGWMDQVLTAKQESGAAWGCLIHHRNGKKASGTKVRGLRTMVYFDRGVLTHAGLCSYFPNTRIEFDTTVRLADPQFGRRRVRMVGFRFADIFGKIGTTVFPESYLRNAMKRVASDLKVKGERK